MVSMLTCNKTLFDTIMVKLTLNTNTTLFMSFHRVRLKIENMHMSYMIRS